MKVGIVGLGYRLGYLARVFSSMSEHFIVVAFVDPDPAGLDYSRQFNVSVGTQYPTLDAMLAQESLDLLMVGSPNHLHLEHIEKGLSGGLKVFTEKPVVMTIEDTFRLASLLNEFGRDSVMVGLVLRYSPLYTDLRKCMTEGMLGEIVSIEASEHIAPYHGAFFMRDWRRYEAYAGSFLLEKCCHDLDLYSSVMGCRAKHVASFGGRKTYIPQNAPELRGINDLEVYHRKPSGWKSSNSVFDGDGDIIDYQTAMVEYENGAALSFHTNLNVPDEFRHFCVIGVRGMAEGDFVRNYFRVHDAHTSSKLVEATYADDGLSTHYGSDAQMARDILAHLEEGVPLPVSVNDALEAGLLALSIDEARRSRVIIDMTMRWAQFDAALSGDTWSTS